MGLIIREFKVCYKKDNFLNIDVLLRNKCVMVCFCNLFLYDVFFWFVNFI